jgi:predicted kinase
VPRIILLNGPPGAGKSTLARRYVDEHPLTANLDVDRVRALIGGWPSRRTEAGLLARAMTLAMAREHVGTGHDVVVPQFLGRLDFVTQLDSLAAELAVPFVEVALVLEPAAAWQRFAGRLHDEVVPEASFGEMHRRLDAVLGARPRTRLVPAHGEPDDTYRALRDVLAEDYSR